MRISDWSSDVCSSDLPDAALPRAAPPPGPYQCRVIKLGHPQGKKSGLDYIAYKGFACHVEAEEGRLWIVKQTGRSEEHTSELQSLMRISYAVFCLKKKIIYITTTHLKQSTKN